LRLSDLAAAVPGAAVATGGDAAIRRVTQDSRDAGPGDLFVAVKGLRADGHDHAASAAERGAAVALERAVPLPEGTPCLLLPDTRWALGELAAELHGRPARRLLIAGVTGSAGKTTTTHLTAHLLQSAGETGYLTSMAHRTGPEPGENELGRTTIEAPELQERLARMVASGFRAAALEVSSHALEQGRVSGCDFDVAAFTNVGNDHLDYHGSFERYLRTKARLIELCGASASKGVPKAAVLNRDDRSYDALAAYPIERRLSYGLSDEADVRATGVAGDSEGTDFRLEGPGGSAPVRLRLPGRFNLYDALCAAGAAIAAGLTVEQAAAALTRFPGLTGRMERVEVGQPFRVYIDFSHTAICLTSALSDLRERAPRRLLTVFGMSGGSDHDPAGMGRAAAKFADFFVITTDDPAPQDPADIARRIESGAEGRQAGRDYEVILDRRAAIRRVMAEAAPDDLVLLAGKGHERSLLLPDGPVPWNEREEAEAALRGLGLARA
jgi:UDP-N-acetylmuramoyl-L-alanyl-D-glutamate--2,6-diaminopimelate ligase